MLFSIRQIERQKDKKENCSLANLSRTGKFGSFIILYDRDVVQHIRLLQPATNKGGTNVINNTPLE